MRTKIIIFVATLAFVGAACVRSDDLDTAAAPELGDDTFTLTGDVLDTREGAEPQGGFPDAADANDDTFGGIAVRPDDDDDEPLGLDACDTMQDAYVLYYTGDTTYEPAALASDDDFPESLERRRVTVEGTVELTDSGEVATTSSPNDDENAIPDDCVLVAEKVEYLKPSSDDESDDTSGTIGGTDQSGPQSNSEASASPEVTWTWVWPEDPDFPEHEDTDPVFEGTPSPDACEGQKACQYHRDTGQEPQP
jgi:hypothetical protein